MELNNCVKQHGIAGILGHFNLALPNWPRFGVFGSRQRSVVYTVIVHCWNGDKNFQLFEENEKLGKINFFLGELFIIWKSKREKHGINNVQSKLIKGKLNKINLFRKP